MPRDPLDEGHALAQHRFIGRPVTRLRGAHGRRQPTIEFDPVLLNLARDDSHPRSRGQPIVNPEPEE
jgi:hypothetical protein